MNARIISQDIKKDGHAMCQQTNTTFCYEGKFHFYADHSTSAGSDQLVISKFVVCTCKQFKEGKAVELYGDLVRVINSVLIDDYTERTHFLIKRHNREFHRYER